MKDIKEWVKNKSIKVFTKQAIESVIHNSVSDYDCLVEGLNRMMYPEEFKIMESDKNV